MQIMDEDRQNRGMFLKDNLHDAIFAMGISRSLADVEDSSTSLYRQQDLTEHITESTTAVMNWYLYSSAATSSVSHSLR